MPGQKLNGEATWKTSETNKTLQEQFNKTNQETTTTDA